MMETHSPEFRLSPEEAKRQAEARKIVEQINDPRLRSDEHLEYFTIHLKDKVKYVSKRRVNEDPDKVNGYIIDKLRQILDREK
jgi:hypothetical protein